MRAYFIGLLSLLISITAIAQQDHNNVEVITGSVFGLQTDGSKQALAGANLRWMGQNSGAVTGADGNFELKRNKETSRLIISFISYQSDTVDMTNEDYLEITLATGMNIKGAEIVHRQKSTTVSHFDLIKSENLGGHELGKAACCNLSESFETSPTVDVSFTDAISGQRQIRMLGLAGTYSQLTKENMPDIRGLAAINGMEFIPGTWIESIQLIQGAGSVVNGFESIAGQINTELQKPATMDRFFFNAYVNSDRSVEGNAHIKIPLGKKWNSGLLLHGKFNGYKHDSNKDGFLDMPLTTKFVALNRYEWVNDKGIHFEFGGRYTYIDQIGGQYDFDKTQTMDTLNPWGMLNTVNKADAWAKFGKINKLKPWQSAALQVSGGVYTQDALYGMNTYKAQQNSLYANFIHQSRIKSNKHVYKLGASVQYDDFDEKLNDKNYLREEIVPGVFGEYSYKPTEKLGFVTGLRADYHNQYGVFITPRVHLRYELFKKTVVRLSAGSGLRTANIIAEHLSVLASSRDIIIHGDNNYGFGLDAEKAWNYGINLTQTFDLDYREGRISASYYRTDFVNQIVFDMDESAREVHFYNLDGQSVSNSYQIQVDYELVKRLDIRMAYRYYDVRTTYMNGQKSAPLMAPHRGFFNIAYSSRNNWKYDFTVNVQGSKRIPNLSENSLENQRDTETPAFAIMNAQISKQYLSSWQFYMGAENIGNYRQSDPIIGASDPYGPEFDASLVWAPLFGIKIYAGMKYTFF